MGKKDFMITVNCPVCNAAASEKKCAGCGTDLEAYIALSYAPDLLYNEAVDFMQKKEYDTAADKLAAAHYLRPQDKEIILLMAQCAELSGSAIRAMEKLAILLAGGGEAETVAEFERLNTAFEQQQKEKELEKAMTALADERFAELKEIIKKSVRDGMREITAEESDKNVS